MDGERASPASSTTPMGKLDKALDEATARHWAVLDMKRDWTMGPTSRVLKNATMGDEYRLDRFAMELISGGVRADGRPRPAEPSIRTLRLAEIHQHILRVSCTRCGRTVEIQMADAVRLAGARAVWKDVGQRLLDDTCSERTGRHEEDGCWPSFE